MKPLVPLLLAASFALPAVADEQKPPATTADATPTLSTTGEWLTLQASGAARGRPNAIPGEALETIYQRYLNSFGPAQTAAAPGYANQAR